ncbi:MAG TPA: hypothetical protein VHW74_10115 [Mycobacteriales bacterium]|jgi:hypothetical protein|nr:hypothetical protein [Mycobacteriales bacterium]
MRKQRWRLVVSAALLAGLPTAAYLAAPAAAGAPPAAPASGLAGFNTSATSAGVQFELLVPGLVPLGDPTLGNFIQASAPYASSTSTTGPSTGGVASPVWPGDAVATAGNALQTFEPSLPQTLVNLLNDPVVARSSFPAQVGAGTTGSFAPTGPAGIGSATTTSSIGATTANAAVTDLSPLGVSKGLPLLEVASASSSTAAAVNATSVSNSAETRIGQITIAGLITINGIDTTATASSDGHHGTPGATTDIGSVKVAGLAASIGPDGITLNGKGQAGVLVQTANKLLAAVQKAGLSITALASQTTKDGNGATATSGAVVVTFEDANLPDLGKLAPQLPIPIPNSAGISLVLGLSQASAAATLQPDINLPPVTPTTGSSTAPTTGSQTGGIPPCTSCGVPPTGGETTAPSTGGAPPLIASQDSTALGVPVRTEWVVIALLVAVLAAGPLLSYANWQLLRGRTP